MELEIKHLAPYLPYGLKGYVKGFEKDLGEDIVSELCAENNLVRLMNHGAFSIDVFKPSLRPLSQSNDYFYKLFCETGNIDDFLTFETLKDFGIDSLEEIDNIKVDYLPHGTFEVLAKHRFDLFDLIPNGLAETIKENN